MSDILNPTCGHFWLALGLVLSILEMVVPGFVLLSLGLGALLPAVLAYAGVSHLGWLLGAYALFSLVTLFAIRKVMGDKLRNEGPRLSTNVHGLVGMKAVVLARVGDDTGPGYVRVQGESWRAVTHGPPLEPGRCAVIRSVSGATVTVEAVPGDAGCGS